MSGLSAEDSEKWESRRLLQDFDIDSNYTDDVQIGTNADKNCTPPGKRAPSHAVCLPFVFPFGSTAERKLSKNPCLVVDLAGQISVM